jgi:hypothetical protein
MADTRCTAAGLDQRFSWGFSREAENMPQDAATDIIDTDGAGKGIGATTGRLSRRATLFLVGSALFALASVVLALEFFVVERIPILTESEFDVAKKRWVQNGPKSYDMEIELRGAQPGSVKVNVRNRVVQAEMRDGRVPPEHTWDTWSVPGMLNTVELDMGTAENPEQAIGAPPGAKWELHCEFDPKLGIPRRYHRIASFGPEVYWRVTRFEAR